MYKSVGDGLVVEYQEPEHKTEGGILLTGVAMSTPHDVVQSKVLSVGSAVPEDSLIKVGDIVLTSKESLVKLDENTRSVKWARVLGVIEQGSNGVLNG